jgi:hypothetical protein
MHLCKIILFFMKKRAEARKQDAFSIKMRYDYFHISLMSISMVTNTSNNILQSILDQDKLS